MTPTRAVALLCLVIAGTPAGAVTFSASGSDAAAIQGTVDAFRDALGANNGNTPENFVGGRRQINWDAAPAAISDPNPFPGDFFNGDAFPRARGIEFRETGNTTGFLLSSDPLDDGAGQPAEPEFGFDGGFSTFSPNRLFSPVGGTTFDVLFFDPSDQTTPAGTRGLGVVFTDVETAGSTFLDFFDAAGGLLESLEVELTGNAGLAFAALLLDDPDIFRVAITSGSTPLLSNGVAVPGGDTVVMDDFIFGEPTPGPAAVPVPLPAALLLTGVAALAALRRRA